MGRMVLPKAERRILRAPATIWETAQLGLSLALRWKPGTIFVIVNVYIDESGTHGAPHMIMAGYAAKLGAWNRFDEKWNKHLRRFGVPYFHARELNNLNGPYKGWRNEDIAPFAQKSAVIADAHAMFGFTVRLDGKDFRECYQEGKKPKKLALDSMWGLCFRASLKVALEAIKTEIDRSDLKINFIVESGHPNVGAACEILKQLKKLQIDGVSEHLGTVTCGEREDFPGLQAADGLAYGSWNIEPLVDAGKVGLIPNPPGSTVAHAKQMSPKGQKIPYLRTHFDRKMLSTYRADLVEYYEFRRDYGQRKYGFKGQGSV